MWRCVFLFFGVLQVNAEDPIATTNYGQVRGQTMSTYRNTTYYAYFGIPYAAPPVGRLRFQAPQPPSSWSGIRDAKTSDKICIQWLHNIGGETEDCLYLNVETPVAPGSSERLPVMVNIYGGGFLYGFAGRRPGGAGFLAEKGVVAVSFNYRVGPFGFLSTLDSSIRGNMGLKDQQMALRWIQQNIHNFGGDPAKVTLTGQSAGSASVTYHLLAPSSAGLFRAAIGQSGSALCEWAYHRDPVSVVYGMASALDSRITTQNTTQQVLLFLQSVPVQQIKALDRRFYIFAPVIDGEMITAPMYDSVKNGKVNKVPLLIGINSEECIGKAVRPDWFNRMRVMDPRPETFLPGGLAEHINTTMLSSVGALVRKFYCNGNFTAHLGQSAQYDSDNRFVRAIIKFAELYSQHADVYFYHFSFQGQIFNNHINVDGVHGVGHGEDLRYLYAPYANLDSFPWEDRVTVERYSTLFTNFAKYENPTPVPDELFQRLIVPKVTPSDFTYLDIDKYLSLKKNPRNPWYREWVSLFDKYANSSSLITY
ncbi:unnamed protein product [Acanthoscelides obtectus]|uniref:Carboxylic ester hydrolase n=2 Tax=Acanthoscelides obtectus TaxID=200917 RepID=A0A9P0LPI1_ACAOB|nr:unnamed protein product [Acanthoscelides obtectus]CAK1665039.1 Cocaine esterase [Acanthoscelides obtectus]